MRYGKMGDPPHTTPRHHGHALPAASADHLACLGSVDGGRGLDEKLEVGDAGCWVPGEATHDNYPSSLPVSGLFRPERQTWTEYRVEILEDGQLPVHARLNRNNPTLL
ncbi:uncharacterized protein GIQ15_06119 [Arthroderma uncinatum]|uniref:uncharacterized protein n=1 Tax=Arthroderma uncinatum TaxID=74035 RepID=UPI00144ADCB3|nr:uncharacterized protein GIQ15_06119 [Arthroderma uncinatum]KAF3480772.1 hypothetical protein GIQ15_06119 [Arthroderma uncinatum]